MTMLVGIMAQDKSKGETVQAVALAAVQAYREKFELEPTHVQVPAAELEGLKGFELPGIVIEGSRYVQAHCALAGTPVRANLPEVGA